MRPSSEQMAITLNSAIETAFFKHFSNLQNPVPKVANVPSLVNDLTTTERLEVLKKEADLSPFSKFYTSDASFQQAITDYINGKYV